MGVLVELSALSVRFEGSRDPRPPVSGDRGNM
jgi:hypothetical protein